MRILRLTNSDDTNEEIPYESRKWVVGERVVAEGIGEPVETVIRIIWPGSTLPDLIDGWIDRYEPDMVVLVCASYWFTYASMPVRVERALGPIGKPVASLGFKAAATPWIARNAGFRALRTAALKTVGGSTYFTPREVTTVMEACLRRIVAREQLAVALRGPRTPFAPEGSPRAGRRAEERRLFVHRYLQDLARRLHVEYIGFDSMAPAQDREGSFLGDFVHINAAEHEELGQIEGLAMLQAWRNRHPARPN